MISNISFGSIYNLQNIKKRPSKIYKIKNIESQGNSQNIPIAKDSTTSPLNFHQNSPIESKENNQNCPFVKSTTSPLEFYRNSTIE